jgi:subtilisin
MTAAGGTTGRYLVLMEDDWDTAPRELSRVAGIRAVDSDEVGLAPSLWEADGLVMRELGVALVTADADQYAALRRAADEPGPIALVEAERQVFAIEAAPAVQESAEVDGSAVTWGLRAVGAPESTATGAGVRVAVLDTGMDLEHPDFAGRTVASRSFVRGQQVVDGHGHGTHCIGTACGPRTPADGPGYGLAYRADIHAGKVLSDEGSGADGGILAGISWALTNGCAVVSMSLGAPVEPGTAFSPTYERIARRALSRGTLIVAAAGNESQRADGRVAPVGHPANCPSILAVGAIDEQRRVADFSCGTVDDVGAVDLTGPGVAVHSSWPMPVRHKTISGTSMATPHAAGVAALIAQATKARGYELWARLAQTARRLPLSSTDIGSGLMRAP